MWSPGSGVRLRPRPVTHAPQAEPQNLTLPGDRPFVLTVDHRFRLSTPALVSAPSKKSFSSVNSPILACSDFTSMAGTASAMFPDPKTPEAPPSSGAFQAVIGLGWTSKGSARYALLR